MIMHVADNAPSDATDIAMEPVAQEIGQLSASQTIVNNERPPFPDLNEEEVVIQEGDVSVDRSGAYPVMQFSKYLTVQPWNRSFETEENHPSQVIVWIRLPGLPYHYYTKSLFCLLAAKIGKAVKIDYNTNSGERGKFAGLAVVVNVNVNVNKPLFRCNRIDGVISQILDCGFCNFVFDNASMDVRFHGPSFTWSRGSLFQRLDRCLANEGWLRFSPDTHVLHLDKLRSDHRPILMRIKPPLSSLTTPPFRFLLSWQDLPGFKDLLCSAWASDRDTRQNLDTLRTSLSVWNLNTFGDIGRRKRKLLARLRGIDNALSCRESDFLMELEKDLKKELELVLEHEENLWRQKSRSGEVPADINRTLLVLIPKMAVPENFAQFRPISLCTVLFKAITKIIVARLKPFLPPWIMENQTSFVPGRCISNNVVIAQEEIEGIGIKSIYAQNEAFLMKMAFRLIAEGTLVSLERCDRTWFGPCVMVRRLIFGMMLAWGSGVASSVLNSERNANSFVSTEGEWNWELLQDRLPDMVCLVLAAARPPLCNAGSNVVGWNQDKKRCFTVSSAYNTRMQVENTVAASPWDILKKFRGLPRVRICYGQFVKVDYSLMRNVSVGIYPWMQAALCVLVPLKASLIFCVTVQWLWQHGKMQPHYFPIHDEIWDMYFIASESVLLQSSRLTREAVRALVKRNSEKINRAPRVDRNGCWTAPPAPWFKLNTDGARQSSTGWAAFGGLIRNHSSNWVTGFSKSIGFCSVLDAELWGIYIGLQLAWEGIFESLLSKLTARKRSPFSIVNLEWEIWL
ncbi:hypothetical protein F3Y22_tig00111701pilonHSYRG00075 [Hibiscus syriacus]|uniref:RNase H type-1 domain-containing protein n=1 Tax=Hibiscus syriacus TaxID=106335 RepID=A0A6A2XGH2_HIBSY|nr:hypothetical protein F3Y22_tig00111701pilonHSYRG00075 [Hibiscus syriacus]